MSETTDDRDIEDEPPFEGVLVHKGPLDEDEADAGDR